ncbi:hypothetical protein ACIBH1_12065 [Nonomuraea sp. NPDC050663]|uniref:hypothetical protein n=1 Tax=Nonomuraea sp. NPDC050663 TaxID=3364370 RepID=UPI0037B02752
MKIRAAAFGLIIALAGCAAPQGELDKAGAGTSVRTLTIGTDDVPGRPAADAVEEFARQVSTRTDGRLRIEPRWKAAGEIADDWDQQVARQVIDGRLDMGVIPARAWDTEGVTSLRALNAPFLITTEEHLRRVLSGGLPRRMMKGLDGVGLTGLALLPEGMRRPFGYHRPLLSPEDYAGDSTAADKALADKSLRGMESAYWLAADHGWMVASGNVTFFPKVNSLVIGDDVLEGLPGEQRTALMEAAAAVSAWSLGRLPDEAKEAERFCAKGGSVQLATDSDLRALERAALPVYADLGRDAETRELIGLIRHLGSGLPIASRTTACGVTRTPKTGSPGQTPDAFPEGVYRVEISEEEFLRAGAKAHDARMHGGVNTLIVERGSWEWRLPSGERTCGGPRPSRTAGSN